ncbi:AN1-type zinc finger domain-containing protein [Halobaculum sp. D14]|uniref:AN1-type zinc finger domain-containing protein n=1 Tax=Halobaculum sp. D14 TaxID=3421642 RepID=UPI003EB70409
MSGCSVCGTGSVLSYTCNYCGETFCSEHRLPESHGCDGSRTRSIRSRVTAAAPNRSTIRAALVAAVLLAGAVWLVQFGGLHTVTSAADAAVSTPDNPWGQRPVYVYVAAPNGSAAEQIAAAELGHWEEHASRYADANVTFARTQARDGAALVIEFKPDVVCDGSGSAVGCAETTTAEGSDLVLDATVAVETGMRRRDARLVLRHELGHVFGLSHNDADQFPWMSAEIETG